MYPHRVCFWKVSPEKTTCFLGQQNISAIHDATRRLKSFERAKHSCGAPFLLSINCDLEFHLKWLAGGAARCKSVAGIEMGQKLAQIQKPLTCQLINFLTPMTNSKRRTHTIAATDYDCSLIDCKRSNNRLGLQ